MHVDVSAYTTTIIVQHPREVIYTYIRYRVTLFSHIVVDILYSTQRVDLLIGRGRQDRAAAGQPGRLANLQYTIWRLYL